jgi:hypothetical protein
MKQKILISCVARHTSFNLLERGDVGSTSYQDRVQVESWNDEMINFWEDVWLGNTFLAKPVLGHLCCSPSTGQNYF